MARLKIKITRNLRRSVLRGHPWVYSEAIAVPLKIARAELAQISDTKGELGWAIYDPHGPLALRFLTTRKAPPNQEYLSQQMARALELRSALRADAQTNAFRLVNGEGDLLPGLVCDVYNQVAVVQFDGQGPEEFWDRAWLSQWLLQYSGCTTVVEKARRSSQRTMQLLAGPEGPVEVEILENGARFLVNLEKGQKTGFFLDQRENRAFVRACAAGRSVLNLFSYSGGFSVNAGLGQASRVASLDVAAGAIELAERNWQLNGLPPDRHQGLCVDVFEYMNTATETWDHVIVDPPSMGHSENTRAVALAKYTDLFAAAAKLVSLRGALSVSSCSSHVSFTDFLDLIGEALSKARRRGQVVRVSGQGADHPFPLACPELRYLKFVHLMLD